MSGIERQERALKVVAVLAMVLGLALYALDRCGIQIPAGHVTARDLAWEERERK